MNVTAPRPVGYPAHWAVNALLADGATVFIRPIKPDDAPALLIHFSRLSEASVYFRFFGAKRELSGAEVAHFTTVDYRDRMAFVASQDDELVGVGRYERLGTSATAEVAFAVVDAHQGRGVGGLLLEHLAAYAPHHGITAFCAEVLRDNHRMLDVFHGASYLRERDTVDHDVVRCTFDLKTLDAKVPIIRRPMALPARGALRHDASTTDRTDPASASRQ